MSLFDSMVFYCPWTWSLGIRRSSVLCGLSIENPNMFQIDVIQRGDAQRFLFWLFSLFKCRNCCQLQKGDTRAVKSDDVLISFIFIFFFFVSIFYILAVSFCPAGRRQSYSLGSLVQIRWSHGHAGHQRRKRRISFSLLCCQDIPFTYLVGHLSRLLGNSSGLLPVGRESGSTKCIVVVAAAVGRRRRWIILICYTL